MRSCHPRALVLLLLGAFILAVAACGGDKTSTGSSSSTGGDTKGQTGDPLAVLKATKYVFFDASAFKVAGQGGGTFVTFHEPAPVTWNGLSFSASPSWTYTAAGQATAEKNIDQRITLVGEIAADGKSIKSLTITETYAVTSAALGTGITRLEFANIPNTSVTNDPAYGLGWLATSKLPAAKSLLVSGTSSFPSSGTQPVSWEGGNQGISVGFSEKPQRFELQP